MIWHTLLGRFLAALSFTGIVAGILLIFTQNALTLGIAFIVCFGLCYYKVTTSFFAKKGPGQDGKFPTSSYYKGRKK